MLGSTDRESVTDESGSLGPIFKGQALQDGANAHANHMWVHRVGKDTAPPILNFTTIQR